jgi:hypothetical protein
MAGSQCTMTVPFEGTFVAASFDTNSSRVVGRFACAWPSTLIGQETAEACARPPLALATSLGQSPFRTAP